jgi:riboflavin kinase/FMN adenylyltransferase
VGKRTPPFICGYEEKLSLIAGLDPQVALVLPFDRAMAELSPEQFVRSYLVEGLGLRELVIGYDYALGKGRKGNYETLRALGERLGFRVFRLDPVVVGGAVVSSTRIRDLVQAGEVWEARPLLGRFFTVHGEVVRGKDRGARLLGFPTANLKPADELFPKTGVYAIWVEVDGQVLPAVANVGDNPTFGDTGFSVEAHIFDFSREIYGHKLRILFVQRIRSERRFESLEALRARIGEDASLAREILAAPEAQVDRPEAQV